MKLMGRILLVGHHLNLSLPPPLRLTNPPPWRFGKVYNICVVCAYGGGSKWEQSKALEAGAELVVATPGRIIDMIKMKATSLSRVTFLVLDEADRMFDMGFEPQVSL